MNSGQASIDGAATVNYFERDAFVGSRKMYCCGAADDTERFSAYWPHTAYFCSSCGNLWARAIYDYHFTYAPRVPAGWVIESRKCVECGDGQLLFAQPLDGVSTELLTRELLALLEGALNGNYGSNTTTS